MNPNPKEPDESQKDLPEKKINSQPYLNQQKCNKKPNKLMYLLEPVYFNCIYRGFLPNTTFGPGEKSH